MYVETELEFRDAFLDSFLILYDSRRTVSVDEVLAESIPNSSCLALVCLKFFRYLFLSRHK